MTIVYAAVCDSCDLLETDDNRPALLRLAASHEDENAAHWTELAVFMSGSDPRSGRLGKCQFAYKGVTR